MLDIKKLDLPDLFALRAMESPHTGSSRSEPWSRNLTRFSARKHGHVSWCPLTDSAKLEYCIISRISMQDEAERQVLVA